MRMPTCVAAYLLCLLLPAVAAAQTKPPTMEEMRRLHQNGWECGRPRQVGVQPGVCSHDWPTGG